MLAYFVLSCLELLLTRFLSPYLCKNGLNNAKLSILNLGVAHSGSHGGSRYQKNTYLKQIHRHAASVEMLSPLQHQHMNRQILPMKSVETLSPQNPKSVRTLHFFTRCHILMNIGQKFTSKGAPEACPAINR